MTIYRLFDRGWTVEGESFLVLEYVDGKNLQDELVNGLLDPTRAYNLVAQLTATANWIHQKNVVHGDIKPANLMISQRRGKEFLSILDFGVSSVRKPAAINTPPEISERPVSLLYMSPEQLLEQPHNETSDVYQIGLVFLECLNGTLPYDRTVEAAVRFRLSNNELRASLASEHIDRRSRAILRRALDPDHEKRLSSMQFYQMLRALIIRGTSAA